MTDHVDFESRLGSRLRSRAAAAARPFDAATIARQALAPTRGPRPMAQRWSSLPRNLRWSAVSLAIAGSLLGVLVIGAPLIERTVRPLPVSNGWVVFTVESNDLEGPSDVYAVWPGAPERAIIGFTRDAVREACPQFSPDGMRIAYLSGPVIGQVNGRDEIRIVALSADGFVAGAPLVLADGLVAPTCPEWSPDSQSVALMTGQLDVAGQLVPHVRTLSVIRMDGSSEAVDPGASILAPGSFEWSPDGTQIAYVGVSSISIAPIDGGAPRHLYEPEAGVELQTLEWSPEGKRILVTAQESGFMRALPARVIQIDGAAAPVELAGFRDITWSPDGQRLAAVRSTARGAFVWDEVVTMAPDGSDVLVLADEQWRIGGLTWAPDGSELAYVETQGPSPGLLAVAASGDAEPRFLLSRPYWLPNTGSDDLSWQAVFPR